MGATVSGHVDREDVDPINNEVRRDSVVVLSGGLDEGIWIGSAKDRW